MIALASARTERKEIEYSEEIGAQEKQNRIDDYDLLINLLKSLLNSNQSKK
jgi:hypothetical protein